MLYDKSKNRIYRVVGSFSSPSSQPWFLIERAKQHSGAKEGGRSLVVDGNGQLRQWKLLPTAKVIVPRKL